MVRQVACRFGETRGPCPGEGVYLLKSTHNEAFYHLVLHYGRIMLADGNAYRAEADAMLANRRKDDQPKDHVEGRPGESRYLLTYKTKIQASWRDRRREMLIRE